MCRSEDENKLKQRSEGLCGERAGEVEEKSSSCKETMLGNAEEVLVCWCREGLEEKGGF